MSFPPRSRPTELPAHWERSSARGRLLARTTPVSLAVMGAFHSLAAVVLGFIRGGERLGSDFYTSRSLASFLSGDVCWFSCMNELQRGVGCERPSSVLELAPLLAGPKVASALGQVARSH